MRYFVLTAMTQSEGVVLLFCFFSFFIIHPSLLNGPLGDEITDALPAVEDQTHVVILDVRWPDSEKSKHQMDALNVDLVKSKLRDLMATKPYSFGMDPSSRDQFIGHISKAPQLGLPFAGPYLRDWFDQLHCNRIVVITRLYLSEDHPSNVYYGSNGLSRRNSGLNRKTVQAQIEATLFNRSGMPIETKRFWNENAKFYDDDHAMDQLCVTLTQYFQVGSQSSSAMPNLEE